MTDKDTEVTPTAPKKRGPGRPPKVVKVEAPKAPEPVQVQLEVGSKSENGLWLVDEIRPNNVVVVRPTPQNKKFLGRTPLSMEQAISMFKE